MTHGEMEEEGGVFLWKLKAFSSLADGVNSCCTSPFFSFEGRSWWLGLLPNGLDWNQSEGYVVLGLWVIDSGPPIDVRYSLGIRTAKGGTEVCHSGTKNLDRYSHLFRAKVIERSQLLRRRNELLPHDTLTLTLELKVEDGSSETVLKNASFQETAESNVADVSVQETAESKVADLSVQSAVEESVLCGGRGKPSEKTGLKNVSVQTTAESNVADVSVQTAVEDGSLEKTDVEKLREHFKLWLDHPGEGDRVRRLRREELEKRWKFVVKDLDDDKGLSFYAA